MLGRKRLIIGMVLAAAPGACNRGPDPMSVIQSPAEYNCLEAVRDTAGSQDVTLLALARTQSGAEAQILANRDGTVWTCRTNTSGAVTLLRPGLGGG